MSLAEKTYGRSPIALQNALLSLYGLRLYRTRYGGEFERKFRALLSSQWWSRERLAELQEERLTRLIDVCYRYVPFYRREMERRGVTPNDVNLKNLPEVFPVLEKSTLLQDPAALISTAQGAGKTISINTSGTTGSPLTIRTTSAAIRENYAHFARFLSWAGVAPRTRSATFAGRTIVPTDQVGPPYWRRNWVMRDELFSSYHLSAATLPAYVDELNQWAPEFIDAYPSAIYTIACHVLERRLKLAWSPKCVVTSSETLLEHQRSAIELAFSCPVFDQYGSAEAVCFIGQCERGSYHVNPEYGLLEVVDSAGKAVPVGQDGDFVCTGFLNAAMPLVRYRIGDSGALSDEQCACGREFPVVRRLLGRVDDLIVTPEGRLVGRLDPVFKGVSSIRETQIIQQSLDLIVIRVVPGPGFDQGTGAQLTAELRKRVGTNITLELQLVDAIPKTSSGKFRSVVSNIRKPAQRQL